MDINDKLILERDIKNLNLEFDSITDKVNRVKREQIDLLDLNKKEKERFETLQKDLTRVSQEIEEAKSEWSLKKSTEESLLSRERTDAKKILNRENFVKLEEEKIIKIMTELDERGKKLDEENSQRSKKDSALKSREISIEKKEQEQAKKQQEWEKSVQELKDKVINHIDLWQTK